MPEDDDVTEQAIQLARHDERLKELEMWREKQNGELKAIRERLDNLKSWLMGVMGSMILALVLLVLNLAVKALGG